MSIDLPQKSARGIPPADLLELARLPENVRAEFLLMWRRMSSEDGIIDICKAIAGDVDLNWKSVYYRVSRYRDSGDWRDLLNRSRAGHRYWETVPTNLPPAFVEEVARRRARNQRDKWRSAHASLVHDWQLWRCGDQSKAIPGYDRPPDPDPLTGIPPGWTYGHLSRIAKPSKFARKMIQIGPKAASSLGPQVLTTRVGIEVGQYYIFDDCWLDFKTLARRLACRLLSFHALDLASANNVCRGYKPSLPNEETGTMERLRECEMVYLVAHLLGEFGYRKAGTTFICEKATATLREREQRILSDLLGGIIKVECGPRGGGPAIDALFTGPGGGNPRWKAPLESWFNLYHNRGADMIEFPGQTGSNSRLNAPEGLEKLCASEESLALVQQILPAERAELLRLGLLDSTEASFAAECLTNWINQRIDHQLEGWYESGRIVTEWRVDPSQPWQPMSVLLGLPADRRDAIASLIASTPELRRQRPLSPHEVFTAGRQNLTRIPPAVVATLLADTPGTEQTVHNGTIEFESAVIAPNTTLCYGLQRWDGNGTRETLRNDERWMVRVNPLDIQTAWLYDARNGFAGVVSNYGRVRRDDPHALHRAFAAKRAALSPLIAEGRRLAAPITRAANERAAHNIAVLSTLNPSATKCPVSTRGVDTTDFVNLPEAPTQPMRETTSADEQERALEGLD